MNDDPERWIDDVVRNWFDSPWSQMYRGEYDIYTPSRFSPYSNPLRQPARPMQERLPERPAVPAVFLSEFTAEELRP